DARKLARDVHQGLNNDPVLPGLRIPTVLAAEDGTELPPLRHGLDEAEHSVAVVLADDHMVVEQAVPAGRQSWPDFVADLDEQCAGGRHRFVPFQLSDAAWPLHPRFKAINFARAVLQKPEDRSAWVQRRLVIELCRFLEGKEPGKTAP